MIPPLVAFHARPPWLGGTLQTLRAVQWPLSARLPPGHRLWLPLPDGDALAAMLNLPPGGVTQPLAVLVHGLAGTEDTPCIRDAAAGLLRRGFPVLRLNLRGSARSLPRSTSHYHLGRSEDLADALATLPEALTGQGMVIAGWSLGGALVLNLLGGQHGTLPILGGAAISPPLQPELAHAAIDAAPILGRALLTLYRREVLAVPARDLPEPLRQAAYRAGSLQEFETTVTVPRFGYPSYGVFCEVEPSGRRAATHPGADPAADGGRRPAGADRIHGRHRLGRMPRRAAGGGRRRRALRLLRPGSGRPGGPRPRGLLRGAGG